MGVQQMFGIKRRRPMEGGLPYHLGLFEPTVMSSALPIPPATFQMFMNTILKDLILSRKCHRIPGRHPYFSQDIHKHRVLVQEVLRILQENQLCVKPEKCEFEQTRVEYLGVIRGKWNGSHGPSQGYEP